MGSAAGMIAKAKSYIGQNYKHFTATFGGGCFHWCAAFVSTIGMESDNAGCVPKDTSCTSQMNWFKSKGGWHETSGYIPKAGDIIYFDWDYSGDCDHVGIVTGCRASTVTTIEGNSGDGGPSETSVTANTYPLSYGPIRGYATPAYGTSSPGTDTETGSLAQASIQGILTEDDIGYTPDFEKYAEIMTTMNASYTDAELRTMHQMSKLRGIIGIPPQFLSTTDLRLGYSSTDDTDLTFDTKHLGTDYLRSIASKMPLVYLTPCEPVFLPSLSGSDKKAGLEKYVKALASGTDAENLDSLLNDYSGKIYSVEHCYDKYFNYINPACRAMAEFLNLENPIYDQIRGEDKPYTYNWAWNYMDSEDLEFGSSDILGADEKLTFTDKIEDMQRAAYYRGSVPLYCHMEPTASREFSNETTQSQLASSVNALSDQARELMYIMGVSTSTMGLKFDQLKEELSGDIANLNDFVSKLPVGGGLFSTIVSGINTTIAGGKLMFPELWSDSSSGDSHSINIKLIAPDPDSYTIWEQVLCPLIHLWGFVSPRQSDKHGYVSPFLVKAFCSGIFNIDMGIVTNMSVTLGKENCWNKDGLPTVVEVQMSIKNLYNQLAMTSMSNMKYGMMANIGEMDFLANLCGVNYNVPDALRYAKMYADLNYVSRIKDIPTNVHTLWNKMFDNRIVNLSNKLSGRY